jgi:hypothetical protein
MYEVGEEVECVRTKRTHFIRQIFFDKHLVYYHIVRSKEEVEEEQPKFVPMELAWDFELCKIKIRELKNGKILRAKKNDQD